MDIMYGDVTWKEKDSSLNKNEYDGMTFDCLNGHKILLIVEEIDDDNERYKIVVIHNNKRINLKEFDCYFEAKDFYQEKRIKFAHKYCTKK